VEHRRVKETVVSQYPTISFQAKLNGLLGVKSKFNLYQASCNIQMLTLNLITTFFQFISRHYWTAFFSGVDDQITMARKLSSSSYNLMVKSYPKKTQAGNKLLTQKGFTSCIDFTSGRSPKTGGSGSPKVLLH
jgi:hypothetical protein